MVATPAETPVTTPDATVAMLVVPQLHEPPEGVALSVMLLPAVTLDAPVIVPGIVVLVTVITRVAEDDPQVPVVVSVIVTVPEVTPVTIPVDAPTVAVPVLLLLQVPPETPLVSVNVIVPPTHTVDGPAIAATGVAITVTDLEIVQPPKV